MKLRHLSKILTLILILLCLVGKPAVSLAEEASTVVTPEAVQAASQVPVKKWAHDLYFESYSSTFSNNLVHFQKYDLTHVGQYQLHLSDKWNLKPYLAFRNYLETASQNMQFEFGLKSEYSKNLTLLFSVEKERLNLASTFWSTKLGLVYGEFFQLPWEKFYSEIYFESYAVQPDGMSNYFTAAGWSKVGYRQFTIEHHIFDPAVVMVRGFDSNVKSIAGADYRQLALGMQYKFFVPQPESGITVFLSKTWNSSATTTTFSEYWLLFAMEVKL